jgi:hypothetical protein
MFAAAAQDFFNGIPALMTMHAVVGELVITGKLRAIAAWRKSLCPRLQPPDWKPESVRIYIPWSSAQPKFRVAPWPIFVIAAVQEAATHAREQAEVIRLSLADQQRFADALLSPPKPSPALKRAMARHDKLLRSEWPWAPFLIATLDGTHDLSQFSCRTPALDSYLREQVSEDIRVAARFIALTDDHQIAGYYTVATASVPLADLPDHVRRKLPAMPPCPPFEWGGLQ